MKLRIVNALVKGSLLFALGCQGGADPSPDTGAASSASGSGATGTAGGAGGSILGSGGTAAAGGSGASGGAAGSGVGGASGDAAGGGSAAGGSAGSATGGSAGSGGTSSEFVLLFRDEFDSLDASRWQLMTHSWAGNLALFAASPVSVSDGHLTMTLLDAPPGTMDGGEAKSFLGAEVRSVATLTYGRVRARMKFASGSAIVSALVTIYTPWPADNWNELDVECLGKDPTHVQFNTMVYTGALPAPSTPVTPTQEPHMHELGVDGSADFHVVQMEWTPASAIFSVDDVPVYTWTNNIDLMTLPQNVLLTIWASSSAAWAGAVDGTTSGKSAVVDWIELYQYVEN